MAHVVKAVAFSLIPAQLNKLHAGLLAFAERLFLVSNPIVIAPTVFAVRSREEVQAFGAGGRPRMRFAA